MGGERGPKRQAAPKSWEPPLWINVMSPQPQPRARGLQATTHMHHYTIDILPEDLARVKEEADAAGLKTASYIRWCVLSVTRELRKLRTGEGYTPGF